MRVVPMIVIVLLAGAPPLAAQAFGVPVLGTGISRGTTVQMMAGFANHEGEGGSSVMGGVAFGGRRIGVMGFASRRIERAGGAGGFWSTGGLVNLKVFGGPLVPFAVMLQGGAAYASEGDASGSAYAGGVTRWHVPVGMAITWLFARPGVSITPWIAPRADHARRTGPDLLADPAPGQPGPRTTTTATEFGMSGGMSFGFLSGLTLEVAYDRVFGSTSPATVGVGFTYPL